MRISVILKVTKTCIAKYFLSFLEVNYLIVYFSLMIRKNNSDLLSISKLLYTFEVRVRKEQGHNLPTFFPGFMNIQRGPYSRTELFTQYILKLNYNYYMS